MGSSTARKAGLAALTLALAPLTGWTDNARDWQNVPTDLNMLFGYYNRIDSNTPIDTSLPIDGLSLKADLYILRYARSFGIDGRSSAIQILQPYAVCRMPYADISASFDNARYFTGTKHN